MVCLGVWLNVQSVLLVVLVFSASHFFAHCEEGGSSAEWWNTPGEGYKTVTKVKCLTSVSGAPFSLEVRHEWSPLGAQRFIELVQDDWFMDMPFFRCVKNFLVQFGISSDMPLKAKWRKVQPIQDDPSLSIPFKRGMMSFAGGGANTRGTQVFISFVDSKHLGQAKWETPFAIVTEGMNIVDSLYTGYGDQKPFNANGIDQGKLQIKGNAYLREEFPEISYIRKCYIAEPTHNIVEKEQEAEKERKEEENKQAQLEQQKNALEKDHEKQRQAELEKGRLIKELQAQASNQQRARDGGGVPAGAAQKAPTQGTEAKSAQESSAGSVVVLVLAVGAVLVLVVKLRTGKDQRLVN